MATVLSTVDCRPRATGRRRTHRLALVAVAVLLLVGAGELTARVEDLVLMGTPLWTTPDRTRDLVVWDGLGIRGKPNGRYKKWRLNQFGFRNGPMSVLPRPGVVRVMVLGASESFGLYERDGREYAARLGARLAQAGSYEVINAAVAGLTLPGISELWVNWAARFKPAVVVIYPTPAFYLGDAPPRAPQPRRAQSPAPLRWPMPRLFDALKDRFDVPAIVQKRRVARWLAAAEANRPADWHFCTVPADRLAQFGSDLAALVDRIRAAGAEPILMTHAVGFRNPPSPKDADLVAAWRTIVPRPTADVLFEFESATVRLTREMARDARLRVVDLDGRMTGHPGWFAEDLLHFNEEGSDVAAALIADAILGPTEKGGSPF